MGYVNQRKKLTIIKKGDTVSNSRKYINECIETENFDPNTLNIIQGNPVAQRLLHASVGLNTEAGEFADGIKRILFRGIDVDKINLAEELGDIFWYCAIAADALGIDFETIQDMNTAKLKNRYAGGKSNKSASEGRDVKAEREILEAIFYAGKIANSDYERPAR